MLTKKGRVLYVFSIGLHKKDEDILRSIQSTLGIGKLYPQGKQGVQFRVESKKYVNKHSTNCVYEIMKTSAMGSVGVEEIILSTTLKEVGEILNVDYRTVKRQLDYLSEQELGRSFVEINGIKVRRVAVFYL
jgi:hypothetical protein